MQSSLSHIFNESARQAHEAFPLQFKAMVIFSTSADAPLYVSPEFAEHLSKNIDTVREAIRQTKKDMKSLNAVGIASPYFPVGGQVAQMIALEDSPPGVFTAGYTQEMRAVYVFDHELGHHVVKNGRGNGRHLGEAAADAFASLRHVQRYGADTEFFDSLNKAAMVVLGQSTIHYTNDTMTRVRQLAQEQDLSKLSLQETAQLADRIALETHLDVRKLDKLEKAFAGAAKTYQQELGSKLDIVHKIYGQDGDAYALFARETLKVMQTSTDADVIRAGYEFLSYPPMKQFLDNAIETRAGWQYAAEVVASAKPVAAQPRNPEPPVVQRKAPPFFDRG